MEVSHLLGIQYKIFMILTIDFILRSKKGNADLYKFKIDDSDEEFAKPRDDEQRLSSVCTIV